MSTFNQFATMDLRLTILKVLKDQQGQTGNEVVLQHEAAAFGLHRSREQIRTEMKFLEGLGAIKIKEAGTVIIGILTLRGLDHVNRLITLDGVNPPSPPGE